MHAKRPAQLAEAFLSMVKNDQPDCDYCSDHQASGQAAVQVSKSRMAPVESPVELFEFIAHPFSPNLTQPIQPHGADFSKGIASAHGIYDPASLSSSNSYTTRVGTV